MKDEALYRISEIASFFGVTTTTIRYYEEYGILKPAKVDEQTRYRYYDMKNINMIGNILGLRKSGMGMMQIKDYLDGKLSMNDYISDLKMKRFFLDKQIKANEALNASLNEYEVDYIVYPTIPCIMKEVVAQDVEDLMNLTAKFLDECIKGSITMNENCLVFIEFNSIIPKFTNIKAILGFEIKESKKCIGSYRPQIDAIRTFHKGSYETIDLAYNALREFASRNNVKLVGTVIEYYYESLTLHEDSKEYLTEIIFPIQMK